MIVYSPEVLALRDRCRNGNNKLWYAWRNISEMKDPEKKNAAYADWDVAVRRLHELCKELESKGYRECLYINDKGEKLVNCLRNLDSPLWFCNGCPAQSKDYWWNEISRDSREPPAAVRDPNAFASNLGKPVPAGVLKLTAKDRTGEYAALLGKPVNEVITLWKAQGRPAIVLSQGQLGPAVTCTDVELFLSKIDADLEHVKVIGEWVKTCESTPGTQPVAPK